MVAVLSTRLFEHKKRASLESVGYLTEPPVDAYPAAAVAPRAVLSFPIESKAHAAYLASFRNALHAVSTRGGAGIALRNATSSLRGRLTSHLRQLSDPGFSSAA
jgi:hypothetical protein